MWCFACLFYCWLTSFLSFILYMMGSPLDWGNAGASCGAGPSCGGVCWWFFLKPFLNLALLSPCPCVLAWPGFHGITSPTPTLLCLNWILLCVCVCLLLLCVLKVGHQCGFPNSLIDPFQPLGVLQIKGTQIFSLVRYCELINGKELEQEWDGI